MDDLSGLSWTSPGVKKPTPRYQGADLRTSPSTSRASTPFSHPSARSVSPAKSSTAAGDSFANLVTFGSGTNEKDLPLAERQRQLEAQKAREEREKREKLEAQYGESNGEAWSRLEMAGRERSGAPGHSPSVNGNQQDAVDDEDDILAAFNASAPVDTSTNFPVPSSSSPVPPASDLAPVQSRTSGSAYVSRTMDDDDDPFGVTDLKSKQAKRGTTEQNIDEDDFLGPLAKPVSEFPRQQQQSDTGRESDKPASVAADESMDKPLADLVDMGFPVEDAREALASTKSGTDVQEAVGWLLNRAHSESQRRTQNKQTRRTQETGPDNASKTTRETDTPAWMRGNDKATAERDPTQVATEFGTNLFKSANSLWKSSTKRVQQAVQDFNAAPPDPSQPRWMRNVAEAEATTHQERNTKVEKETRKANGTSEQPVDLVTDEAIMLEPRALPSRLNGPDAASEVPTQRRTEHKGRSSASPPTERASLPHQTMHRELRSNMRVSERSQLSRLGADEEASQAYVSPARRRRADPSQPTPESQLQQQSRQVDPPQLPTRPSQQKQKPRAPPSRQAPSSTQTSKQPAPSQVRPKAPARSIPPIEPSTLRTSTQHRQKGSEAFKRGDFSAAHASYSSALSLIPESHPIAIVLLTNRALTGLKIGDSKSAVSDADRAMSIVGPTKGESEKIDLQSGEQVKEMKDFYGKALMRKAEALEQLERWADAAKVWQEAVEYGHGGSTSIQGRNRCEKAAEMRQESASKPTPKPHATPSRMRSQPVKAPPTTTSAKSTEAVSRLRAANDAADRADNEKFALSGDVESRIAVWKDGKQDNLRALLSSLETVLWPEAQWKKINMSELLLPNKVKIQYMKGISKVHPDKIPVDATTEQRMIAGAVFSTLNDAWEKFKVENGL